MSGEAPLLCKRDRGLSVSVFKKQNKAGNTYYRLCVQNAFKLPNHTEWTVNNINLFPNDLPRLLTLLNDMLDEFKKQPELVASFHFIEKEMKKNANPTIVKDDKISF